MTQSNNFMGLSNVFFLKYIWSFSFVLTNFSFFFFLITLLTLKSVRENDYVERISVINVELSYVNKAMSV